MPGFARTAMLPGQIALYMGADAGGPDNFALFRLLASPHMRFCHAAVHKGCLVTATMSVAGTGSDGTGFSYYAAHTVKMAEQESCSRPGGAARFIRQSDL